MKSTNPIYNYSRYEGEGWSRAVETAHFYGSEKSPHVPLCLSRLLLLLLPFAGCGEQPIYARSQDRIFENETPSWGWCAGRVRFVGDKEGSLRVFIRRSAWPADLKPYYIHPAVGQQLKFNGFYTFSISTVQGEDWIQRVDSVPVPLGGVSNED